MLPLVHASTTPSSTQALYLSYGNRVGTKYWLLSTNQTKGLAVTLHVCERKNTPKTWKPFLHEYV